ncbi:MAG: ABC transporter permease [Gemmatimonadota bacterium]
MNAPGSRRSFRFPWREPKEIDADLDDELRFHVEMRVAELQANGLSAEEARREALRRFGDLEDARHYCRSLDHRRAREDRRRDSFAGWRQDIAFALRQLIRNPAFTTIAVVTLALGIGANTAIFSVVHRLLLDPLPYVNGNRIVMLMRAASHDQMVTTPTVDLVEAWQAGSHSFEKIERFREDEYTLTGAGDPETLEAGLISATMPGFLGVHPLLGRTFLPEECAPGGAAIVVLGYGIWQRRFGGRTEVLGQAITLGGRIYTIVGVMPRDFDLPYFVGGAGRQVWLPLVVGPTDVGIQAIGRLRPGISAEDASHELTAIMATLPENKSGNREFTGLALRPQDLLGDDVRATLLVLFGVVGVVLLIACANVANLLLARASTRSREFVIRAALGAGRGRLIRQLLTESLCLAILGGVLGLLLAWRGLALIVSLRPESLSALDGVRLQPIALAWSLGVSILTGLLFGLAPAFLATEQRWGDALRSSAGGAGGPRSSRKLRGALVVLEVALSVTLLIGAGLLVRTVAGLEKVELGFEPRGLIDVPIVLPKERYPARGQLAVAFRELVTRLRTIPGASQVTLASGVPPRYGVSFGELELEGHPLAGGEKVSILGFGAVQPEYFHLLGLRVLEGRIFDPDTTGNPVMINRSMARRFWPGTSPIGHRMRMSSSGPWQTIIGVVSDVRIPGRQGGTSELQTYSPFDGSFEQAQLLFRGDPATLLPLIRREVSAFDPLVRVRDANAVDSMLDGVLAGPRFSMALFGAFALLALLLATVGLYGVIAYSVSQRTREIGVRIALGAGAPAVIRLVVSQGLRLTIGGVVLGLVVAAGGTRAMRSMLYEVSPLDPFTFGAVALGLTAVAVVASYIPARRAARVDPVVALRSE